MDATDKGNIATQDSSDKEEIGIFKKMQATMCHHCPLCSHARKKPDSVIGKIMHHKAHSDNCPLWNAEKEVYGEE